MSGQEQMNIEDFLDLIVDGDIEEVQAALDAGFDVNTSRDGGYTPLMLACESDSLELVTLFLDRGANVNAQGDNGFTALIYASNASYTDIVNELCLQGADVNMYDNSGKGALYYAAQRGNVEIVHKLFIRGANLDAKDNTGMTSLMEAASRGYDDVVQELIIDGADVNALTLHRNTAVMLACKYGHAGIVNILCTNGADVNNKNNDGLTCLVYICRDGNEEIANILLENGADPNLAVKDVNDASVNMTPIMAAAYSNSDGIIKTLIAAGARMNETSREVTALMLASKLGKLEAVIALCESGADKSVRTANGKLAVDYAKTDEIREYLTSGKISGKLWKGMTQSDITKLNTIFEDNAINYSTCPVCLEYVERSEACMYMKHDCSKGPYYHTKLYTKYKSEGKITWCTICGRICHGHRHYKLTISGGPKPALEEAGDPFASDCRGQGGGGLPEKLSRFRELRKTVLELEEFIDKKPMKDMMDTLIARMWNAPLFNTNTNKEILGKIMNEKKWNANTRNELFRRNVVANANANAPNLPFEGELPVQKVGRNNIMFNEDVPILSFRHRQRNGSIEEHGIAQETLEEFLARIVKEFGTPEFGLCFMHPVCDARLHPEEVRGAVPEELYKDYKKKFNKKFRVQAGGGGIFREATDAVCAVPKKRNVTKKGGKRKGKTRRV
jgi:ankyrin repeat protein